MRDAALPMPGRYAAELAVMEEMSWSWRELGEAPADLVEEILVRRGARLHWERERAKLDRQKSRQRMSGAD